MAKLLIKNSFTATSAPAGLSAGEIAVNVTDRKLFVGNAVGGVVTLIDPNALVTSVNGLTGAITNVAMTNQGNTFSVPQVMNAGITSTTLYASSGVTFNSTSAHTGLATFNGGLTASNIFASSGVTFNSTSAHTGLATFSGGINGVTASFTGSVSSDAGYQITSGAINAQTGTTYSLLTTDNGKIITWNNNTSGVTLTVPSGLPIGFNTTVIQTGTGSVGITGSGVTMNSFEGKLRIVGQHGAVSIISYASNVFNVAGGLTG